MSALVADAYALPLRNPLCDFANLIEVMNLWMKFYIILKWPARFHTHGCMVSMKHKQKQRKTGWLRDINTTLLGTTCSTLLASTFCCMRVWSAVSGASHSGVRSRKASSPSSSFTKVNDLFNRSVFFAAVCFVFCLLLSCYQWIVIQTSTETRTHVCTHACTHTCTHAHTYTQ